MHHVSLVRYAPVLPILLSPRGPPVHTISFLANSTQPKQLIESPNTLTRAQSLLHSHVLHDLSKGL